VTDALSFAEYKNIEEIKRAVDNPLGDGQEIFLGELILCYDDIREYADSEGMKLEKELANVVSHGILHLLGFEHSEEMFALQEKIKNKFQ
jgi:probable rRNA maturation factor